MIALWIIGSIVIIITILLNCPVTADLKYMNKIFDAKIKYLFFTVYPQKEKIKKPKKEKKTKKIKDKQLTTKSKTLSKEVRIDEKQEDIPEESNESQSRKKKNLKSKKDNDLKDKKDEIFEKIAFLKTILESSKKGLRHLVKGIYISDINLDFIVANEDAFEAAVNYGKINMITFNVISFIRVFFTISIEKVDITCKFNSSDSEYGGQCKIKLRPSTVILSAISIFYHYVINTNKKKKESLKENAQSAS